MKKIVYFLYLTLIFVLLTSCKKEVNNDSGNTNENNTVATSDALESNTGEEAAGTKEDTGSKETEEALSLYDYYPMKNDMSYTYEGEGNEYAGYTINVDYLEDDRIQLRSNNGGSETVRVLEIKDGMLLEVLKRDECYYRENLLDKVDSEANADILLKEPLEKGTQWTTSDNQKRYISNVDVSISTPSGDYNAIEVTTEGDDGNLLDYYAKGVGLVKSIYYVTPDDQITSSLSKIEEDVPFKQTILFFLPDADTENIYTKEKEVSFATNDITRNKLESAIKEITLENGATVISSNTKIDSLYLNEDNVVYVDFSKELISEMNAGAGYESLILQCITNTLGTYYSVDEVYITVEGEPYESGHIVMKKGETFKVDLDNVVNKEE